MLARALPGFLEAARLHYLDLTGLEDRPAEGAMNVYVLSSWKQWAQVTRQWLPAGLARKVLTIRAGGYFHPRVAGGACVYWNVGGSGAYSLAGHEGLHQFLYHRLEQAIPKWLEESLCTLTEGMDLSESRVRFDPAKNPSRRKALRRVLSQNRWIPLAQLVKMDAGDALSHDPDRPLGFYAQLWSLGLYLRSQPRWRQGLEELLQDAQAGRMHEKLGLSGEDFRRIAQHPRNYNRFVGGRVIGAYFRSDPDKLEADWKRYARQLAWGRD
jgi:hypothetical protein